MMHKEKQPQPATTDDTFLVAELRPALVSFFRRRCGDTAEAEDLAQDVMLRAFQHAAWGSRDEAKGYIFKIAMNRWKDRGRRKLAHGIQVDWGEHFEPAAFGESPIERALDSQQELRIVSSALGELSERTRDVLILHRLEKMKQAEIAAAMGISVSAVEKHLVRALAHLAQRMVRDGQ